MSNENNMDKLWNLLGDEMTEKETIKFPGYDKM